MKTAKNWGQNMSALYLRNKNILQHFGIKYNIQHIIIHNQVI